MPPLKLFALAAAFAVLALATPRPAAAVSVVFELNTYITGTAIPDGPPPAGSATWTQPYVRATFTDTGPGAVRLTMEALGIDGLSHAPPAGRLP
jgi:hypothetical protein